VAFLILCQVAASCRSDPNGENLSLGTPDRSRQLEYVASGYSYSGIAFAPGVRIRLCGLMQRTLISAKAVRFKGRRRCLSLSTALGQIPG